MRKSMANFNTYVHRGQNVVSSKAFNRKDANTDSQKAQRASFKLISDAWASLGGFAEKGFPSRPEKLSPYNYFMALNLPNAIDNPGEIPVIDYGLMQIAKGTYPVVNVNSATLTTEGLTLNCISNIDFPNTSSDDILSVLAKTKTGALFAARQPEAAKPFARFNLPCLI